MRNYPENAEEMNEELADLNCEKWMVEQLQRNPSYVFWGPHEDYQWIKDYQDPNSPRTFADWSQFKRGFKLGRNPIDPKDRSGGEVVHWYFSVQRDSTSCGACDGGGYNPETEQLSRDWYNFSSSTGRGWQYSLTQDEADALLREGRLRSMVGMHTLSDMERLIESGKISRGEAHRRWEERDRTKDRVCKDGTVSNWTVQWRSSVPAEEVNKSYRESPMGHDAINRCICVQARAERLGVYGLCPECKGNGHVYVEPCGRLALVLWIVNPATGQNYGLEISSLREEDLNEVYEFIISCGDRLERRLTLDEDLESARETGWCGPLSVLRTFESHSWRSSVHFHTWKEMRGARNFEGNLLSPEHPDFASTPKSWELDDLNELIGIHFENRGLHAWLAHPRKGCSRKITVDFYDEEDLEDIRAWVDEAQQRTAERFSCRPE